MSLGQLCDEIKRVRQETSCTPVLAVPRYLSLRNEFLVSLCGRLVHELMIEHGLDARATPQQPVVRLDWLCSGKHLWSTISDPWRRMRAAKINAALQVHHGSLAQIQVTSTIGRPFAGGDTFVFGLSDTLSALPSWTRRIRLLGTATSTFALQFS